MKRIALITQNFQQGGLETNILTTIDYLKKFNYEFYLVSSTDAYLDVIEKEVKDTLLLTQEEFSVFSEESLNKISDFLDKSQIEAAFIHPYTSYHLGSVACHLKNIPYFVFVHGPVNLTVVNYKDFLFNKYFTFPNAANIYCVSEELNTLLDENFHTESKILVNPINMELFEQTVTNDARDFVFIGRLDDDKVYGLKEVIQFTHFYNEQCASEHKRKLIVVGEGNQRENVMEWLKEKQFNDEHFVEFKGYHSNVSEFISSAALVFGMGRVVLESLTVGVPAVLVSYDGLKGFVNLDNIQHVSQFNFSGRNSDNVSYEAVLQQIKKHEQASEQTELTATIRKMYDIEEVGKVLVEDLRLITPDYTNSDLKNDAAVFKSSESMYEILSFIELTDQENQVFDFIKYFKGKIEMIKIMENRRIEDLENRITDKEQLISYLENDNQTLKDNTQTLQSENKHLSESLQALSDQVQELKSKSNNLEFELNRLQELERQHLNHIASVENQKNVYHQQLNSIYNSKFWKLPKAYYSFRSKDLLLNKTLNYTKLHGKKALLKKVKQKVFKVNEKSQREKYMDEFLKILKKNPKKEIVLFPTLVDWNIPLFQRPQHIALNMANEGYLYFFCTNNIIDTVDGFDEVSQNCYVTNANEYWIIEELSKLTNRKKLLHLYSTDNIRDNEYVKLVRDGGFSILYEYVDEIHEEISGQKIQQRILDRHHAMLADESVTVISTADKLYKEAAEVRSKNFALVTNGVQLGHFEQKTANPPEEIQKLVASGRPIIGYFGAFAKWFNYELVEELALKHPEWDILLIGKDYDGSINNTNIYNISNIHVVGPINYYDLPKYAQHFSVSTIPFRINDITDSTSPIKLFEYMALDKPIVTTAMPECRKYKSVLIGENHKDFIEKIEDAISLNLPTTYFDDMKKEYHQNTWDQKAKDIINLL